MRASNYWQNFWMNNPLNDIFQSAPFCMTIHYKSECIPGTSQYSTGSRSLSFSYWTLPDSASSRRMRGNIKYNQHSWYGLFLSVVLTWLCPLLLLFTPRAVWWPGPAHHFVALARTESSFTGKGQCWKLFKATCTLDYFSSPVSCLVISATLGWCLQCLASGSEGAVMLF